MKAPPMTDYDYCFRLVDNEISLQMSPNKNMLAICKTL